MKPNNINNGLISRRDLIAAGSGLLLLCGCTGPAVRSQSPESDDLAELDTEIILIGNKASPRGLNYEKAECAALVVGLKDTGSDPPNSSQRSALLEDMKARRVNNAERLLASPTTSLVWARAFIPPGAQQGDTLDIEVRVPADNDTTDLSGGWMMECRLKEMAFLGGSIREGHDLAIAQGAVLVDPMVQNNPTNASLTTGRVLSGGKVLKSRNIGLVLHKDSKSTILSKRIGDALNRRFHTYVNKSKKGIANPTSDELIDLIIHPSYKHNIARYVRVITSVPISESPRQRLKRLQLLEQQLLDPFNTATAALRLEAIGKEGIEVLKKGMESKDPEVQFYSAEALAYLDQSVSAKALGDAARNEPAFRVFALTALSTLNDTPAIDELCALMDVPSSETRYGAFRALWGMNKNHPLVKGEDLQGRMSLHIIPSNCPPLVHVTRSYRAEVVLFGQDQYLHTPFALEAGKNIVVKGESPDLVTISRFALKEEDKQMVVSSRLDEIIRAIIEVGGHYPDVVQFLQSAKQSKALDSKFEVDALPRAGRRYTRGSTSEDTAGENEQFEVFGRIPNLFGGKVSETRDSDETPAEDGTAKVNAAKDDKKVAK
ncbi:MAG: flagellar basal body P-ring protein FlgI [Planctomycetota bacterium]|nr:flagellar basal body P-ring protein FlgI [Planctomycetota bacterium]